MRIDKVLMACDDNGNYLHLWKYVAEVCKKILNVTPVLFHITDQNSEFYNDGYGMVKKVKKLSKVKSSIQAQFYRIYGASFFPNDYCLTSDIDMIIPNKNYFIEQVKNLNYDSFVIYMSDVYNPELPDVENMFYKNRLPLCYYLGRGKDYVSIFEIENNFSNFMYKVLSYDVGYDVPYGDRDEIYTGHKIFDKVEKYNFVFLKRGVKDVWDIPGRIEKNKFFDLRKSQIEKKYFVDFHVPNNFSKRKLEFEEIYNQIYKNYSEI